ncbi:MAG TPA: hypothetical protein VF432_01740 [Thermoanaerobaculia bacterium]
MTQTTLAILALVIGFASFPVRGAIQLRLSVEPQSQLPAIEPSLRVEAVNTGSTPAELPFPVVLQVTPPGNGKPFIAHTGLRGNDRVTWFESDGVSIVLAPNESRDLSFWAGPESPVWFAADSRLLSPGTYRLQLVSDPKLDSELLEKVEHAVDQPGLADPIVSNEMTYVVETPKGEDAAVWELIKQLRSPMFWPDALGSRIWTEHPQSRYTAYCLRTPKASDPVVAIAAYTATLARRPARSRAEWFRLSMAQFELMQASSFVDAKDAEAALAASERAGEILRQLAREALPRYVRKEAQRLADSRLMSRESIVRAIDIANGQLKEVKPFVVCVEKGGEGGNHVFWFGYENTAGTKITIPIGPENKFTPPPFDRGQPIVFRAGYTFLGLRVVTNEPSILWHLQKHNIHAVADRTEPCPADLHQRFTYKPPLRE